MDSNFETLIVFAISFIIYSQIFKFKNDSKNATFCAYSSFIISIKQWDNENISFGQFVEFLKNLYHFDCLLIGKRKSCLV